MSNIKINEFNIKINLYINYTKQKDTCQRTNRKSEQKMQLTLSAHIKKRALLRTRFN